MKQVVECVPNVSEGRDRAVIDVLAAAVSELPLLHRCSDPDHNRTVFTFAGAPEDVLAGALSLAGAAFQALDLRQHVGVHPRIGVLDVLPFVPVRGLTLQDCAALAHRAAGQIWNRWRVPSFFYEAAGSMPLETVRRLAAEGADPDTGIGRHASAGAVAIGARPFLIAWNIWLETDDLSVARRFARQIRASGGGFPGVKALGLPLASRGMVQVSINSTDYAATPLRVVYKAVQTMAVKAGVGVQGAELIGLLPDEASGADVSWLNETPVFPHNI